MADSDPVCPRDKHELYGVLCGHTGRSGACGRFLKCNVRSSVAYTTLRRQVRLITKNMQERLHPAYPHIRARLLIQKIGDLADYAQMRRDSWRSPAIGDSDDPTPAISLLMLYESEVHVEGGAML